jgi:hypothetical protein
MQHFSPVQPENARPEVIVEDALTEAVEPKDEFSSPIIEGFVLLRLPALTGNIWFRPPPSL